MANVSSQSRKSLGRKASRKMLFNKTWTLMLPSILFLSLIAIFALALIVIPDDVNRRTQYEIETYRAMNVGDYQRARNCLESLIQLSEDNPRQEYLYQLAILSQQVGDGERAFRLLQRLTLPNQPGYNPAHRNLADIFLSQNPPTTASLDEAERHIQALLTQRPDDPEYLQLLARLQLLKKQPEDALKTYGLILERDPSIGIPMAQILLTLKREDEAKTYLNRAKERLQDQLDLNFEDGNTRLKLADTNLLLKDYQQAARILQSGIALGDPNNVFRRGMCIVLAQWADSLSNSIDDLNRRMNLLIQGISLDPTNPMLLDQFWKLAIKDLGQDPNQILKLRVMGANTNVLEAMSGLQSLQSGDVEKATESFRSALKKSPDLAILLNNLSTIGELRSEKNSDISVKLLNILVEISPENANIRENRGMILIRNKQFAEGIKDLESILTDSNNLKAVHIALSDAYSELGNREKADFHKVAAEKIDKPNLVQKNENAGEEKNDKPAA